VPLITASRIADGTAALKRGEWEDARDAFAAALAAEETGAAWEGLGWAAWWLSDEATTLRAREAAYRAFRGEGDDASAGRVAAWLASDFREFRGEDAVARGWLVRAHRLLDCRSRPTTAGSRSTRARSRSTSRSTRGRPPATRASRRGSGASSASPTSRRSGSRSTGSRR
jgi:hypothetical protein